MSCSGFFFFFFFLTGYIAINDSLELILHFSFHGVPQIQDSLQQSVSKRPNRSHRLQLFRSWSLTCPQPPRLCQLFTVTPYHVQSLVIKAPAKSWPSSSQQLLFNMSRRPYLKYSWWVVSTYKLKVETDKPVNDIQIKLL